MLKRMKNIYDRVEAISVRDEHEAGRREQPLSKYR